MGRFAPWLLMVGLLLLPLVAYIPLGSNNFVDYDDELYLTTNPHVLKGLSWDEFRWAWTTYHVGYWMPLSWLSLELDSSLFTVQKTDGQRGLSAKAIHLENLGWHAASGLLLFRVLLRLTGCLWRSFLVAALFAVHPMHVESVAWASERKDVLMTFFGLLTLLAYARYVENPGAIRYLLLLAAYLLSLLSKPMLITLPFVLLLMDYWPLRRLAAGTASCSLRLLLLEKFPLILLAVGVGVATLVTRHLVGTEVSLDRVPLSARLANTATAYGWYLLTTFWPVRLAVLYPHPRLNWAVVGAAAGAGTLVLISGLVMWQGRRRPWMLVGWLWFVGTLVPVIGLAQGGAQAWADRFSYWPHIGLFVMLVWGLAEVVERLRIPRLAVGAALGAVVGCLAWLTAAQVRTWRDSITLWERVLVVSPETARAHMNLARMYEQQGRLDQAMSHLTEAVRLEPKNSDYQAFLGMVLLQLGHPEEAIAHLERSLQSEPRHVGSPFDAWQNLGVAHLRLGKPAEAVVCFRKALEYQPQSVGAQAALGLALARHGQPKEALGILRRVRAHNPNAPDVWHALGVAHLAAGHLDEAVKALRQALRLQPGQVTIHRDLGTALGRLGDWDEAVYHLELAVNLTVVGERQLTKFKGRPVVIDSVPLLVLLRCQLAFALKRQGDEGGARLEYQEALRRDPSWPRKLTKRAWKLITDRGAVHDLDLAYELVSQAAEATDDPSCCTLAVLTAAQAIRGRISEALATAQRTLKQLVED